MPETKNTATRFVTAFNAHDEAALFALHAPHIKFNAPGGFKADNAKDATGFAMAWLKAYPHGKMTVRSEIVSSPWIIQEIVKRGVSVLIIEHDMHLVMDIARKVIVIDFGKKIAEGTPLEVQKDTEVLDAYLGGVEYA